MNKEESLTFLQSCMEKVKMASEQDIQFYREVYRLDCVSPTETSDFEFVLPAIDLVSNRTPKMQLNYSFLGTNLLNQQNNDNLPYAA